VVAALPVHRAVLDSEAIILRPDNTSDFEALRSRQRQAEAILVAYDIVQVDGQDAPGRLEWDRNGVAVGKSDPDITMVQSSEGRQRKNAPERLAGSG
jgi:hypothetical protein